MFVSFFGSLKLHRASVALCALVLAGCGSGSSKPDVVENPNAVPTNYRADILDRLQVTLDDPSGVREAFIAEPALKPSGNETRYVACVRYNARNKSGAYEGVQERAAFFYNGRLTTLLDATKEQCGGAAYQPFPELEKLCRVSGCPPVRR